MFYKKILDIKNKEMWTEGDTDHNRYECMGAVSLINDYIKNKTDINILDAGCSDGISTKDCLLSINKHGKNISFIGVDIDKDRIKNAQKDNENNIEFICCDLDQLKFKNKFDIIICLNVIRFIKSKNKKRILQKFMKMLKSDGVLITGINKYDMKQMNLPALKPPKCPKHITKLDILYTCKKPRFNHNDTRIIDCNKVDEYANLYS